MWWLYTSSQGMAGFTSLLLYGPKTRSIDSNTTHLFIDTPLSFCLDTCWAISVSQHSVLAVWVSANLKLQQGIRQWTNLSWPDRDPELLALCMSTLPSELKKRIVSSYWTSVFNFWLVRLQLGYPPRGHVLWTHYFIRHTRLHPKMYK